MSVDQFSKQVAALCARHNLSAEWFPWTYRVVWHQPALLERLRWKP